MGGFGLTYLATDANLNLKVAIKEYLPDEIAARGADNSITPRSPDTAETFDWGKRRFLDESRTVASFRHPNIVRVMRFFEANGTAYMVMEFVEGAALPDWMKTHRPLVQALRARGEFAPLGATGFAPFEWHLASRSHRARFEAHFHALPTAFVGLTYADPPGGSHTCLSPKRSKWLIRNVTTSTVNHPMTNWLQSTARMKGFSTDQIVIPMGRHCQNSRSSARLAKSTNVERSMVQGTICVHRSLNQRRAMTLCCTAKIVNSMASTASAGSSGPAASPSSCVGTPKPPTNAIA